MNRPHLIVLTIISFGLFWLISSCSNLPKLISPASATETAFRLQSRFQMLGVGMAPTIPENSIVIVDEKAYKDSSPVRGDIVLFQFPFDTERSFVKRVIGLTNERIEAIDGRILVNGIALEEKYLQEPPAYEGSWETDSESYFVLGDNRNSSSDSHAWGTLGAGFILGKVIAVCKDDSPEDCVGLVDVDYDVETFD